MALEDGDYIDDLVPANPTVSDPVNQGDDHIRLIKKILTQAFPSNDGAFSFPGSDPWTIGGLVNGRDIAADGAKLDDVDAYGQIVDPTTVQGVGILSVTQVQTGEWQVTFENAAPGVDNQVVTAFPDNQGIAPVAINVGGIYHQSTTVVRIFTVQVNNGGGVGGFNDYPVDIIRFIFP